MKGSLTIVCIFFIGVLLQFWVFGTGLIENETVNIFAKFLQNENLGYYTMLTLMFFVGVGMGCDTKALDALRHQSPIVMLVPIGTIVGTLLGSALITPLLDGVSLYDSLAVGSGFGYYSLSSITISQVKGAELGTIALVSNIMREILTLLLAPIFVKVFGKLAPIASAGATSMDTTLPIISKFSGKEYAVLSIFHGIILTILVPIIVSFFVGL